MKNSLKLLILFLTSFLLIFSCSIVNDQNNEKKANITSNENKIFIDVGKGKIGGDVSFKINLSEGFKTKSNVNGWDSKYDSINSYKIALVTGAGTGVNSLTTLPLGTSADVYSITKAAMIGIKTSPTAQIFLKNVPAGTYWVAVAAYDSYGRNISAVTGTTGTIAVASGDNFAVSTSGGDVGTNDGRVTVAADFSLPSNTVTTPLTLIDAFGADIEAIVTITDGATKVKGDITSIRFYLVDSKTTSNLVDANIKKGPFDLTSGAQFTSLKAGTATTITFKSVPAGTYYVAVSAYSTGPINSTTNITNLTSNTFSNITITTTPAPTGDMGTFSISNSGGDGGVAPGPGRVAVNSTFGVSNASAVVLPIKLLD